MSQTPQQQGTTPEILQHYLTAGIDVQVKTGWGGGLDVLAGKLVGLCPTEKDPVRLEMVNQGGIKTFLSNWYLTDCLPILRPFSALCEPLEDGTVPAVEVAKILTGGYEWTVSEWGRSYVVVVTQHCGYDCVIRDLMGNGDKGWGWEFEVRTMVMKDRQAAINTCAAYDYLRSKHFAVGLEPGQYIEKVSSAAPIDKNTAL